MSNRLVSVIIVSAGKADYVRSCVESVRAQTYRALEITVIDNSLDADFGRLLGRQFPSIRVYSGPDNLFYCRALNKGIETGSGDFVLCLNDDVTLEGNFIEEALRGFAVHERIGMVSGKILRTDRQTLDSTGLFLTPWRTAKDRGYGFSDRGHFERPGYIFGVSGAVALYRRHMLEELKEGCEYFDASFQMFYEDLDIAWRAQNSGWKGYYVPAAIAYHLRGATARQPAGVNKKRARVYLNDELHMHLIKNRYMAILKNESALGLALHAPAILLYDAAAWGYVISCRPRVVQLFLRNARFLKLALQKRRSLGHLRQDTSAAG